MQSQYFLHYFMIAFCALSFLAGIFSSPVFAEPANASHQHIVRPMVAIDTITLQADNVQITLWGIKPAQTPETPLELKALDLIDGLIGNETVNCMIISESKTNMTGRCTGYNNIDLGLELLNHGYAVIDRRQTINSPFAPAYMQAQNAARLNEKGLWRFVAEQNNDSNDLKWLQKRLPVLGPLSLILGPFAGLLIVAFVMHYRLNRLELLQQGEMDKTHRKESMLLTRERYVLISTLEVEMSENRNSIEAFLTVYDDMLKNMTCPDEKPKYQMAGDIVQKHPPLSKSIFEANVAKLSILDMHLAGQISKLYMSMPKEQEYITIEADVPLDTAVKLVEKVLKDAHDMLLLIDQTTASLHQTPETEENS
ncbi:MAG: thermonuclease family protein [Alphaproteobacteria bacterium]|nr:thermonuclease family protein [Alphaproteobacteria bacterium]